MFPSPIAKPQNCNIQQFYSNSSNGTTQNQQAWNKPVGVSHVYIMLIGGGGAGDSGVAGGGSGAVTVWYGAAKHVPDSLVVAFGTSNKTTLSVRFRTLTELLSASDALVSAAGVAMTPNQFAASGFFKSTGGQNGSSAQITPSATTFLSGGAYTGASLGAVSANYGYMTAAEGFFILQPIIVGVGANGSGRPGIGCGAPGAGNAGGPGFALIASW
jgi:hypothetical protein